MAATIARAIGRSKGVEREATRLGHESAEAQANTFKTFATAKVNKDGSGSVQIEREIDGRRLVIHRATFGPETEPLAQSSHVEIMPWGSGAQFDMASNGGQF